MPDDAVKEQVEQKMHGYDEPMNYTSAVSFAELQAQKKAEELTEVVQQFPQMVNNILSRPDIEDKSEAIRGLAVEFTGLANDMLSKEIKKEMATQETNEVDDKAVWSTAFVNDLPDSSFLYIQSGGKKDGQGKTVPRNYRHFPYKDASGKVDLPHLRNAIARIPQSNAPGLNKRELQDRARRILANEQKELDEESWVERVTNKIKEKFGLKEKEQQLKLEPSFSVWKEAGQYRWLAAYSNNFRDDDNPPEIISAKSHKEFDEALHNGDWPMPELWLWHIDYPVGKTLYHAYDESTGFAVAGGVFDKGKEWAAEGIIEAGWSGVSHSMPHTEIKREEKDKTILIRHRTREISPLPNWAAANKLAFNIITKELEMKDKGLSPEKREEFVKAFGEDRVAEMETVLNGKAQQAKENGTEQKETTPEPEEQPLTRKELYEALALIMDEVKSIKESQAQQAAEKEEPQDLVAMLKAHSAIGKDETRVDGRTKEAKDGPAETPAKKETGPYGVSILDNLVKNKQAYAMQNRFNVGNLPPEMLAAMTEANQ